MDEGGDLWVSEVDSIDGFRVGDKYIPTFDDMGTSDPYDDELIDIFWLSFSVYSSRRQW